MKTLLDLSKELGVRAEKIRQIMADKGLEPPALDAEVDADTEAFLRDELGQGKSLLDRFVKKWFTKSEDTAESLFNEVIREDVERTAGPGAADSVTAWPTSASHGPQDPLDELPSLPRRQDFDLESYLEIPESETGSTPEQPADDDEIDVAGIFAELEQRDREERQHAPPAEPEPTPEPTPEPVAEPETEPVRETLETEPEPLPETFLDSDTESEAESQPEAEQEAEPESAIPMVESDDEDELTLDQLEQLSLNELAGITSASAETDQGDGDDEPAESAIPGSAREDDASGSPAAPEDSAEEEELAVPDLDALLGESSAGEGDEESKPPGTDQGGEEESAEEPALELDNTFEELGGLDLPGEAEEAVPEPAGAQASGETEEVNLEMLLGGSEEDSDDDPLSDLGGGENLDIEALLGVTLEHEEESEIGETRSESSGAWLDRVSALKGVNKRKAATVAGIVLILGLIAAFAKFKDHFIIDPNELATYTATVESDLATKQLTREGLLGHYEALDRLQERLPDSPDLPDSEFALGNLAFEMEQWQKAVRHYERALELNRAQEKEAESPLTITEFRGREKRDAHLKMGIAWMRAGNYDAAEEKFREVQAMFPNTQEEEASRLILGDLYYAWGREIQDPAKLNLAAEVFHSWYLRAAARLAADDDVPEDPPRMALVSYKLGQIQEELAEMSPSKADMGDHLQAAVREYNGAMGWGADPDFGFDGIEPTQVILGAARAYKLLGDYYSDLELDTVKQRESYLQASQYLENILNRKDPSEENTDALLEARLQLAWCYLGLGREEQAIREADKVIQVGRDDSTVAQAYFIKGEAYAALNDEGQAVDAYLEGLNRDKFVGPSNRESQRAYMRATNIRYYNKGEWAEAAVCFEDMLRTYGAGEQGPYSMRALFLLGECYMNMGEYGQAIRRFDTLIRDRESFQPYVDNKLYKAAHFLRAHCRFMLEQYQRAVEDYEEAFAESRKWIPEEGGMVERRDTLARDAHIEMGDAYRQVGAFDKAIQQYRFVLGEYSDADPEGALRMKLADTLLRTFDYGEARDVYYEVAGQYRNNSVGFAALEGLARAYEEEARTHQRGTPAFKAPMNKAIETYEGLVKLDPESLDYQAKLGLLLHEAGRYRESNLALEKYFDREPEGGANLDPYRYAYAMNCLELNDPDEALKSIDRMVSQSRALPDVKQQVHALLSAGKIYFRDRQFGEAEQRFARIRSGYSQWAEDDRDIERWLEEAQEWLNRIDLERETANLTGSFTGPGVP